MKTQISTRSAKGYFMILHIFILTTTIFIFAASISNAQTLMVDPLNSSVNNVGDGFASTTDNGPAFVMGNNGTNAFTTNRPGFDYFAWGRYFAADGMFRIPQAKVCNDSYVRLKGDASSTMEIDWQNYSKVSAQVEWNFEADARNNLFFDFGLYITAGGSYSNGDSILVYYEYDICGSGKSKPEGTAEDAVHCNNSFYMNGNDELGTSFCFNNPAPPQPLRTGIKRKNSSGTFKVAVGDLFNIKVNSEISDTIRMPGAGGYPVRDRAMGHFWGKLKISVFPLPVPVVYSNHHEFSLDIGSDSERSDPIADGDEVFDPGDAYVLGGPALAPNGQNGIQNDHMLFMGDPMPVPNDPATAAPCGNGLPLGPVEYFDLDGMDYTSIDVMDYDFGPGKPSVPKYDDPLIHLAENMLISFDDDSNENYTYNSWGYQSVPVNSASPYMMNTYGQTDNADEVIAVDFDAYIVPSPGFSVDSLWDEKDVHISMSPNPDGIAEDDDDVDALDFIANEDLQSFYYFSADHEATYYYDLPNGIMLKSGSIYARFPWALNLTEVINCSTHLGLNDGTDIDAFEFGWVWDTIAGRLGLALLFSVDDDDWLTSNDESGGLDPAMIYYSFLNGTYSNFSTFPCDDDVDAITICKRSFNGWLNNNCYQPFGLKAENITNSSADLSWTPGGSETSWNIEYGPAGFMLGTGTLISGVGNPHILLGLTSNFDYDFYVQADCDGGNTSSWAGPCTFTTGTVGTGQTLYIPKGWSGLSTWLHPQSPVVSNMFAPVASDVEYLFSIGGLYWPAMNINTIGNWDPYEGYIIKVSNDASLQVCGTPVSSTTINLSQGWNLIPVLSSINVDVASTLGALPCFVVAKGIGGNTGIYWVYSGSVIYNTLPNLEPGQAYWVYMACDCSFTFPPSPMKASSSTTVVKSSVKSPWNEIAMSPNSHLIAIDEFDVPVRAGDYIGVFNQAGLCSGVIQWNGKPTVINVYGDDPSTSEIDGFIEGEAMIFKVYHSANNTENIIDHAFDSSMPEFSNKFKTNGLSRVALKTSINELEPDYNISLYPNPAKDIVNVTFGHSIDEVVELSFYDVTGRLMLKQNCFIETSKSIDVSSLTKGVYQLILKFPDGSINQKLIIN